MANTLVLLEKVTVGAAGAASITFSSIPQTGYNDLKIVYSARTTAAARDDFFKVQLNGSSSNFSAKVLYGSGSGAASFSDTSGYVGTIDAANATANTFNNGEFYLPNYTSTNAKSFSVDTVQEDNQAQAFITMTAGLWNPGTQAAITSITFVPNSGSFVQYSTFSLYGVSNVNTTPLVAPKATGGDIIQTDGTYWIHTFLTSGTFTPSTALSCDYLVVAGGGGGGADIAGGGGAGGLRSTVTATGGGGSLESALNLAPNTSFTVTVGAGGAGGIAPTYGLGSNGTASVFSTISSTAGGGGGTSLTPYNGSNGGSGGGASGTNGGGGGTSGGTGTTNQGYGGGVGYNLSSNSSGGGGGGAGAVGATANGSVKGSGGTGVATTISGTSTTYAGGGGGGTFSYSPGAGLGGTGGGGAGGAYSPVTAGTAGTANTGGGGGGGSAGYGSGGAGGSGIVIVRYAI